MGRGTDDLILIILGGLVYAYHIGFLKKLKDAIFSEQPSSSSSAPTPTPTPAPSTGAARGSIDANGMKMIYRTTGKKVAMGTNNHRNGTRYNGNHKFTNYLIQGYFKIATK